MCHSQKKKELSQQLNSFIFTSRGDWIRTSDHTPPRRVELIFEIPNKKEIFLIKYELYQSERCPSLLRRNFNALYMCASTVRRDIFIISAISLFFMLCR